MKHLLLSISILAFTVVNAQNLVSSVNSGAVNNSNLAFTVGEIFVLPTANPNEANSGLIGALSRIEFLVSGVGELISTDDTRAYPNPVTHSLYFETGPNARIQQVYIYDVTGRLVQTRTVAANRVDLTGMQNGTYLIKTDLNSTQSFKIIKQ